MENGIKPLDPRNRAELEAVVRLHGLLLAQSPVARLGTPFMRRFYYRELVQDGLICVDLCYSDGVAAGFVAYTRYASDFMAQGLRRHWLRLAGVMAGSVVRRPLLLGEIVRVLALMRNRKQQAGDVSRGEILSLGVLPEYRSGEFARRTGRRVSLELFGSARDYFARQNIASFRMLVGADNREALLFYHALGCEFKPQADAAKTVEVTYTQKPEPGPAASRNDANGSEPKRKKLVNTAS